MHHFARDACRALTVRFLCVSSASAAAAESIKQFAAQVKEWNVRAITMSPDAIIEVGLRRGRNAINSIQSAA